MRVKSIIAVLFFFILFAVSFVPKNFATKAVEADILCQFDDAGDAWVNGYPVWLDVTMTANDKYRVYPHYPPMYPLTCTARSIPPDILNASDVLCMKNYNREPQSMSIFYLLHVKLDNGKEWYLESSQESVEDTKMLHNPDDILLMISKGNDQSTGYLTKADVAAGREFPYRDYAELGPKGWLNYGFNDSEWNSTIYDAPNYMTAVINPESGMGIGVLSSYEHTISQTSGNDIDYYRRHFNLWPTDTATYTQTETPVPIPTSTATKVPPLTFTFSATAVNTSTPLPTATPRPTVPGFTPVPTNTVPPTNTFTQAFTPVPTNTVPATRTFTPMPPTSTYTQAPIPAKAFTAVPQPTLPPTPVRVPTQEFIRVMRRGTPEMTLTVTPVQLFLVKTLALVYTDKNEQRYTYKISWFSPIDLKNGFKIVDKLPEFLELRGFTEGGEYDPVRREIVFILREPVVKGMSGELFYVMKRGLDQTMPPGKDIFRSKATGIYVYHNILYSVSSNEVITKIEPTEQNK